jgi:hypothetical protein
MELEREAFLVQAREIADLESKRSEPVVALLTGSAAWGTVSSRSDIDIIFLSRQTDIVSYRYYLPQLTGVSIRTEVGRIPLSYLENVLASGYSEEISTGLREQLKNARILFGNLSTGNDIMSRFRELKPKKRLLGEYLHQMRTALGRAKESLEMERAVECILALDDYARNLWRLLLVAKHRVGVQKDKHEIKAARHELDGARLGGYEVSRRIDSAGDESASSVLYASRKLISKALALLGVEDKILGDPEV